VAVAREHRDRVTARGRDIDVRTVGADRERVRAQKRSRPTQRAHPRAPSPRLRAINQAAAETRQLRQRAQGRNGLTGDRRRRCRQRSSRRHQGDDHRRDECARPAYGERGRRHDSRGPARHLHVRPAPPRGNGGGSYSSALRAPRQGNRVLARAIVDQNAAGAISCSRRQRDAVRDPAHLVAWAPRGSSPVSPGTPASTASTGHGRMHRPP
jgi:hypothetical protein